MERTEVEIPLESLEPLAFESGMTLRGAVDDFKDQLDPREIWERIKQTGVLGVAGAGAMGQALSWFQSMSLLRITIEDAELI